MTLFVIGIIANILLAYGPLPHTIRTIRAGKSLGVPVDTSIVITCGVITMFIYLTAMFGFNWLVFINNFISASCWTILFLYGVFRK